MASKAKTARFTEVVAKAGRPGVHLTFHAAADDPELQAAIKAQRVMSLTRFNLGPKKDYGQVGYDEKSASQILIFPKSLRSFEGRRIVGINYDLLAEEQPGMARNPPSEQPAQVKGHKTRPARPRSAESGRKPSGPPARRKPLPPRPATSRPAAKEAPKKKPTLPRKLAKPPRMTLRQKLEQVLQKWETGSEAEARGLLREVTDSLKKRRSTGSNK